MFIFTSGIHNALDHTLTPLLLPRSFVTLFIRVCLVVPGPLQNPFIRQLAVVSCHSYMVEPTESAAFSVLFRFVFFSAASQH